MGGRRNRNRGQQRPKPAYKPPRQNTPTSPGAWRFVQHNLWWGAVTMWAFAFTFELAEKHIPSLLFFLLGLAFLVGAIYRAGLFKQLEGWRKNVAQVVLFFFIAAVVCVVWWFVWPQPRIEDRARLETTGSSLQLLPTITNGNYRTLELRAKFVATNTGKSEAFPPVVIISGGFIRPESTVGEQENEIFSHIHDDEKMGSSASNPIPIGGQMEWNAGRVFMNTKPDDLKDLMENRKALYISFKFFYGDRFGPLKSESCALFAARDNFTIAHACWGHTRIVSEDDDPFLKGLRRRLRGLIGR